MGDSLDRPDAIHHVYNSKPFQSKPQRVTLHRASCLFRFPIWHAQKDAHTVTRILVQLQLFLYLWTFYIRPRVSSNHWETLYLPTFIKNLTRVSNTTAYVESTGDSSFDKNYNEVKRRWKLMRVEKRVQASLHVEGPIDSVLKYHILEPTLSCSSVGRAFWQG